MVQRLVGQGSTLIAYTDKAHVQTVANAMGQIFDFMVLRTRYMY